MKKALCVMLTVIMAVMLFVPVSFAKEFSADSTVIIVGEGCDVTELYAAQTLQNAISDITGKTVAILRDNEDANGYKIIIGKTAVTETKADGLANGSYIIKTFPDKAEIIGAGNKGNIYGVYRFLEEFGSFRCYSPLLGFKSYTGKLEIPENAELKYAPYFEYTQTDWRSAEPIYSLANGINGTGRSLSPEQGGIVSYVGSFCHTLTGQYCSADKYFESHPEYFALENGIRKPTQLCLTNEDVYNVVLGEVMEDLKECHDPNADLQIVSLTQADSDATGHYCHCDNCRAVDEANGSPSGTMISFVNRIAREVKKAGYDNVAIDTFAYRYTRKAPTQVKPEPNVIVRICTIECCFSHTLDDASCEANVELMNDLAEWNKLSEHIYIWDYTTNYAYTVGIFPDFGVIQKNMQTFAEHGVKGVYEEGNYYINNCDTEFGELRSYLLSRLMQNPYCDIEKEM